MTKLRFSAPTISPPVNQKVRLKSFTDSVRSRVMGRQPAGEGAVARPQLEDAPRVGDGRLDPEPIPHDSGIAEQPQDGEPGEAGLVHRQHQTLEQRGLVV
jgi:hypothetical protein